jgi:hypothetical protein
VTIADVPLRYQPGFAAGLHDHHLPLRRLDMHLGLAIGGERASTAAHPWSATLAQSPTTVDIASVPLAAAGGPAVLMAPTRAKRGAPFLQSVRAEALMSAAAAVSAAGRAHATETGFVKRVADRAALVAQAAMLEYINNTVDAAGHIAYERVMALAMTITSKVLSGHGDELSQRWVAAATAADANFSAPSPVTTYASMRKALEDSVFAAIPDGVVALEAAYTAFNETLPREYPGDARQHRQFHSLR